MNSISHSIESFTTFLEDNFVLYDPRAQDYYTDFSQLSHKKVIFIGERHRTKVLRDIQTLFLQSQEKVPTCVLLEGLPCEESLTKGQCSKWDNLSDQIQLRGSDIRTSWTAEQYSAWIAARNKMIDLEQTRYQETKQMFREVAGLLNQEFLSGNASIWEGGKLQINLTTWKKIKDLAKKALQWDAQINDLNNQINSLHTNDKQKFEVKSSNEGLAREVIKACQQFSKVIAVWGMWHFIASHDIFNQLDEKRISYAILLPNQNRLADAEIEIQWQEDKLERGTLILKKEITKTITKIKEKSLLIPYAFQSFFHPTIKKMIKLEKQEQPKTISSNDLLDLCRKYSQLTFSSNLTLQLEYFDFNCFQEIEESLDQAGGKIKLSKGHKNNFYLDAILNDLIIFSVKRLVSLLFEGDQFLEFTYVGYKPVLKLSSDKSFYLQMADDCLLTSACHLLREMERRGECELTIKPNQFLYFRDIPLKIREESITTPKMFLSWFKSQCPSNKQVNFSAPIIIQRGQISLPDKLTNIEAITLKSENGFKIILSHLNKTPSK